MGHYWLERTISRGREDSQCTIAAPRAIINTYYLQAGMSMLFCILLDFCITDMEAAASDPT
jgi:hypothetical protein